MLILKFAYINAKHINTSYIFFKFNYNHIFFISYKEDIKLGSKSKSADKLAFKLQKFITIYKKKLLPYPKTYRKKFIIKV